MFYFQIAVIVNISICKHLKETKGCELQTALDFIDIELKYACKYDNIQEMSTKLMKWGIADLVVNCIVCVILYFGWQPNAQDEYSPQTQNKKHNLGITVVLVTIVTSTNRNMQY